MLKLLNIYTTYSVCLVMSKKNYSVSRMSFKVVLVSAFFISFSTLLSASVTAFLRSSGLLLFTFNSKLV